MGFLNEYQAVNCPHVRSHLGQSRRIARFILKHYYELKFSPAIETELKQTADNPKRRQRNAKKQLQILGVGTKSQQALQMQREEMKTQRNQTSKEQRETEKRRQFDLKQQKRKAKHRGH